jgi:AraC-like DNA-binding protein
MQLLLGTSTKIIEIANQCEFQSLGQFNLAFKLKTKLTPSAWRKTFAASNARHQRRHPPVCPRDPAAR